MMATLRHIVLFFTLLLVVFGEGRAVGSGGSIINNDIFEAPDDATRLRYSKAWNHLDLAESGSKVDPAVITKLADDILDNPVLETFLEGGVGRVKAWEALSHNTISQTIRTNTTYLSTVSEQIDNYPSVLFKLDRVVPNIPSNKLDDYFNALDNPKSIYQLKVLAGDFENIPGVQIGEFSSVSNGIAEMAEDLNRTIDGKMYTLKDWHPTTFVEGVTLSTRLGVELIETLDNGIELIKITSGTKLYRVFDGYAPYPTTSPRGTFWTFEKPNVVEDVINGIAVQPDWNGMTKIIEIEAPAEGIIVWRGKAARQPLSTNYNIQNRYLEGGTEQVIFDIDANQINLTDITSSIELAPWTN